MKRKIPVGLAVLSLMAIPAAGLAQVDCGDDAITAVAEDSTVTVIHSNAHYNCCSSVTYAISPLPGGYLLVETEGWPWCYCTCCFTLQAHVQNVPPGERLIVLRFNDYDTGAWRDISTTVTVPDVGQGGDADLAGSLKSACGGLADVPSEDPQLSSWGLLKAIYR